MNMFDKKSSNPGLYVPVTSNSRICHLKFSTISTSLQAISFPTLKWAPVSAWRHQASWRKKVKWIVRCDQLECVRVVSKQWTNNGLNLFIFSTMQFVARSLCFLLIMTLRYGPTEFDLFTMISVSMMEPKHPQQNACFAQMWPNRYFSFKHASFGALTQNKKNGQSVSPILMQNYCRSSQKKRIRTNMWKVHGKLTHFKPTWF